jgi:hypothetical protein
MSRLLSDHRQDILALMTPGMDEKARFDGLATELSQVLGEATDFNRPDQTLAYLRKFSKQNNRELLQLYSDLSLWIDGKSTMGKVSFAGYALMQPYADELLTLVPKVQRLASEGQYDLGALDKLLLLYQLKQFNRLK